MTATDRRAKRDDESLGLHRTEVEDLYRRFVEEVATPRYLGLFSQLGVIDPLQRGRHHE